MSVRIHHATAARALALGVTLEIVEGGVKAAFGQSTVYVAEPKEAASWAVLAETIRLEWPGLEIISSNEADEALPAFVPMVRHLASGEMLGMDSDERPLGLAPDLAEVLERASDQGWEDLDVAPEAGEEQDEEERTGGVVKVKYKVAYKERGCASHCGDWLAEALHGAFDVDDVFHPAAFEGCLRQNGVPFEGKWATLPSSGQNGWQGRFRMNGRQVLEKHIAETGILFLHGTRLEVPADDLADLRTKHAKWLAKRASKATMETKAA
jgi:hypothetical protein